LDSFHAGFSSSTPFSFFIRASRRNKDFPRIPFSLFANLPVVCRVFVVCCWPSLQCLNWVLKPPSNLGSASSSSSESSRCSESILFYKAGSWFRKNARGRPATHGCPSAAVLFKFGARPTLPQAWLPFSFFSWFRFPPVHPCLKIALGLHYLAPGV